MAIAFVLFVSSLTLFCAVCPSGKAASESPRSVVEMEHVQWDSSLQADFFLELICSSLPSEGLPISFDEI